MYRIKLPEQSNRASWMFTGLICDINDNPIDLTGMTLQFSVRDKRGAPRLCAQNHRWIGMTIIGLGTFQWFFTLQQMSSLGVGTYGVGMTMQTADLTQTIQVFIGYLPIIDGNMPPMAEWLGGWGPEYGY